jgi:hypothetical protein
MEFIRDDGRIYNPEHKDTIKRLIKSEKFDKLENVTVNELKDYAKTRKLSGYSTLNREDLIVLLKEGG